MITKTIYLRELIAILRRCQRTFNNDNDDGDSADFHQFPALDDEQRPKSSHYLQFSRSFSCFREQTRRCGYCCPTGRRLHPSLLRKESLNRHMCLTRRQLVRHTAQNIFVSKGGFVSEYFSLIRKNCIQKYNSRLNDMNDALLRKAPLGSFTKNS